MEKESVKKFDLEAAFKALDEIEIPQAKGIKANRVDLKERFSHKPVTETLVEDYYDVSSVEDLEEAKDEREGEVAQAKLARIEKIVDLDAETAEDLLPSYVGKVIMQCPQCMTLFYKNPEDIEHSEENPDIVNLNEPCQHCGNTSGYTLIGKVDSVKEDEADKYEGEETSGEEENELDLDFEEPTEETSEESSEEAGEDLDLDLDLDLEEVPEEEPEEEKKEESLNLSKETSENGTEHKSENLTLNEDTTDAESAPVVESTEDNSEGTALNEEIDKDLDAKLKAHNDYIEYLKNMIKQEEEALKKTDNEEVKAAIQRRLDAFNEDLEAALPDALKDEVAPVEEPIEEPVEETPAEEEPTEVQAEEEPKEEAPVEEDKVEEALTAETEECKVVLSDKPEKEVFAGSKEDCEKIIEKNKDTNTAKEHGLEIVEPAVDESLNKSEEAPSESETENHSENLTLNEDASAEIDSIIASWGLNESLTEEGNLDKLLDSDEFKTPVSEEEIEAAREEVKEESLEECNKQELSEDASDPEVEAIINSWEDVSEAPVEEACEGAECEEGYKGTPEERTTHLEYTDDDPTDGKAVLPDNIEKQLTEDTEETESEEIEDPAEENIEETPAEETGEETTEEEKTPLDVIKDKVDIHGEEDTIVIAEKGQLDNPDAPKIEVEVSEEEKEILEPEFHEEDIDELDECSLNKHIDEYLKEVYSNVKSFEATECELKEGKLMVEGKISFNSGKEKLTIFEFLPAYCEGKLFFEGYNKDFSEDKAFTLNCSINKAKTLITESFGYKYKINETLVEGLK